MSQPASALPSKTSCPRVLLAMPLPRNPGLLVCRVTFRSPTDFLSPMPMHCHASTLHAPSPFLPSRFQTAGITAACAARFTVPPTRLALARSSCLRVRSAQSAPANRASRRKQHRMRLKSHPPVHPPFPSQNLHTIPTLSFRSDQAPSRMLREPPSGLHSTGRIPTPIAVPAERPFNLGWMVRVFCLFTLLPPSVRIGRCRRMNLPLLPPCLRSQRLRSPRSTSRGVLRPSSSPPTGVTAARLSTKAMNRRTLQRTKRMTSSRRVDSSSTALSCYALIPSALSRRCRPRQRLLPALPSSTLATGLLSSFLAGYNLPHLALYPLYLIIFMPTLCHTMLPTLLCLVLHAPVAMPLFTAHRPLATHAFANVCASGYYNYPSRWQRPRPDTGHPLFNNYGECRIERRPVHFPLRKVLAA